MKTTDLPIKRDTLHGIVWTILYRCMTCGAKWSYTIDQHGPSAGFKREFA